MREKLVRVRTRDSVEDPCGRFRVELLARFSGRVIGILLFLYLRGTIWGVHGRSGREDEKGRGRDRTGYLPKPGMPPRVVLV